MAGSQDQSWLAIQSERIATSALDTHGSIYHASGDGDWNVNMGGSGTSNQAATTGSLPSVASVLGIGATTSKMSPLLLVALALGALWLLKRH